MTIKDIETLAELKCTTIRFISVKGYQPKAHGEQLQMRKTFAVRCSGSR